MHFPTLSATMAAATLALLPAPSAAFAPPPSSPAFAAGESRATKAPSSTLSAASVRGDEGVSACGSTREDFLHGAAASLLFGAAALINPGAALATDRQDTLDVSEFLRTGVDSGGPMGVSSQAGKSRPETGVVLRDGSDISRDSRSGDVLAEIVVGTKSDPVAVLVAFSSPWPLATGPVYDVECRDAKTGDGTFLSVTGSTGGKSLSDLPSSFFLDQLFAPTGRFSFYGPPTDIKSKKSQMVTKNGYRLFEVSFSQLSQSTQTEIPRTALVSATIPEGTDRAVMLVTSATGSRWRKAGVGETARDVSSSFRAIPAPKTSLKVRRKERGPQLVL